MKRTHTQAGLNASSPAGGKLWIRAKADATPGAISQATASVGAGGKFASAGNNNHRVDVGKWSSSAGVDASNIKVKATGRAKVTAVRLRSDRVKVEVGKLYSNAEAKAGPQGLKASVKAGADAITETVKFGNGQKINIKAGLNVNTGVSCDQGVGVRVAGFGASIGRNMAIKTPFGSIGFKLW